MPKCNVRPWRGECRPRPVVSHSSPPAHRLPSGLAVNLYSSACQYSNHYIHICLGKFPLASQIPSFQITDAKAAWLKGVTRVFCSSSYFKTHVQAALHWCWLCMLSVLNTRWADQALPVDPIRLRWDSDIKAGLDRLQISAENHFRNPWDSEARKQNITIERGALTGLTSRPAGRR